MTLHELEKLEALHAAATPGEWTPDSWYTNANVLIALHNAFPAMSKALREAWQEREDYRNDAIKAEANEEKATDQLHTSNALLTYLVEELSVLEGNPYRAIRVIDNNRILKLMRQAKAHLLSMRGEGERE